MNFSGTPPAVCSLMLAALVSVPVWAPAGARADDYQGATHMMPFEEDTIHYNKTPAEGAVPRLQRRIDDGTAQIEFHPRFGYLPGILRELGVSTNSQMLVFSKTSFQRERISPHAPRAVFYGDNVYVGYVVGLNYKDHARETALTLLSSVGIPEPERRLKQYPHEMSGGMRQRAMIALALSCDPSLLLADEPTTALDATVQIQVLLLIRELQRDLDLGVIFVTHDIGVAVEVSDRIGVMYAGKLVELGGVEQIGLTLHEGGDLGF